MAPRLAAAALPPPVAVGAQETGLAAVAAAGYTAALAAALAAALTLLVVRLVALRSERVAWALLAGGAGLLGAAQLALVWSQPVPSSALALAALAGHPEVALAGLVAYPLFYAGQMMLLRQRLRGVLPSAWLDGLGAGLLLSACACAFGVPVLSEVLGLSWAAALALALRPLMDLLLVLFAASSCGLAGWRADRRLQLVLAAFTVVMVADVAGVLRLTEVMDSWSGVGVGAGAGVGIDGGSDALVGTAVNLVRLVALLLLVAATAARPGPPQVREVRWSSIAGPTLVMVAALGLLLTGVFHGIGVAALVLAVAALATVGAKLVLLFREVLILADSRRLALSDDLTGLANRRALRHGLDAALLAVHEAVRASESSAKVGRPMSGSLHRSLSRPRRRFEAEEAPQQTLVALLLLDLNGFKAVNDRHGHDAGDALLRSTAAHLQDSLPASALLVRLGGDEFAVLLTGNDAARAVTIAGAAAAAVARASAPHPGTSGSSGADPGAGSLGGPLGGPGGGGARLHPRRDAERLVTSASVGVALYDASAISDVPPDVLLAHDAQGGATSMLHPPVGHPQAPVAASLQGGGGLPATASTTTSQVAGELLRRADVAMYRAKSTGGGVRTFDATDDEVARSKAALLEDLRQALSNPTYGAAGPWQGAESTQHPERSHRLRGQLVVHYQPQVDVLTGCPVGLEALVRWRHPRLGLLTPDAFIDLAEAHGLLEALTAHVLHTAARDAVRWQAAGHRLRVAVNLSTSCLSNPALLPLLRDVLAETGIEAHLLTMEITETMLMVNPAQALSTARGIRELGVQLSIDDYGTGYSSLAYLSDLPATELKLDRSFTSRLTADATTAAIVASTVGLAHQLGLRLLAEGVEDAATLAALASLGCDETQGYLHARPIPAHQVTQWLRERGEGLGGDRGGAVADRPGPAGVVGTGEDAAGVTVSGLP